MSGDSDKPSQQYGVSYALKPPAQRFAVKYNVIHFDINYLEL